MAVKPAKDALQEPPGLSPSARWYCAVTSPGAQVKASLELYRLGYRTLLIKTRRFVRHARSVKIREYPVLGRYLFVEVDHPRQSFGPVCLADGIETLLCRADANGAQPVAFPSAQVEQLRMRWMAGEWDEASRDPLPIGARIRIVEGQFAEMMAVVTQRKGQRIDFKLAGQNTYGRLQACSVRAV
jgi:hypothetical protein